jgi:multidrug efflux pump subunit AcrA (membrane-fusion protein)
MSTDQAVNSDTIEQTKQQIRGLVSEIAQLSKSDLDAAEYFPAFLQRIVQALAAVGGAIWVVRDGQRLELAYQINMEESLLSVDSEEAGRHVALLNHIAGTAEPQLIPPQSGTPDGRAGNPTNFLLVLAPMQSSSQIEGVVEVFQRPDAQPVTQRGYLKFVIQMCELAGEWLKTRKLRQISDRHSLWEQADHFSRAVHDNLDTRETAYTIVNEGRRMLGCDRVSVGLMRGRACKIEAVSGQDAIENRSNIANLMGRLATRVVATGESLWYDGAVEDLPPQVEDALDAYVDESHSKMITIQPIRRPKRSTEVRQTVTGEADDESNEANEIIGALIVEQIESDIPDEVLRSRVDLVYEHSARALANSIDHNRIPMMPVWNALGKSRALFYARNLPKTVAAFLALVVIALGLTLWPADFNLKADGKLQPVLRQDIFVPVDGDVIEVRVEDNQQVKQGDLLVRLRNTELQVQYRNVVGELLTSRERLASIRYILLHQRNLSDAERNRLAGEQLQLDEEIASLERQKELLERKLELLEIRSPIDGQVMMSWDVQRSLERRPVSLGQKLMTVADPDGDWELELDMREGRSGHVRNAIAEPEDDRAGSAVSYVLATDPGRRLAGTVKDVKPGTEVVKPEEGAIVKIKVAVNPEDIETPHPGATVTAKVYCGKRPLGYTWFHEAWEWFEKKILFYLS